MEIIAYYLIVYVIGAIIITLLQIQARIRATKLVKVVGGFFSRDIPVKSRQMQRSALMNTQCCPSLEAGCRLDIDLLR